MAAESGPDRKIAVGSSSVLASLRTGQTKRPYVQAVNKTVGIAEWFIHQPSCKQNMVYRTKLQEKHGLCKPLLSRCMFRLYTNYSTQGIH